MKSIYGRLIDRLYENVICDERTYCLTFNGRWVVEGYGMLTVSRANPQRIHRAAYELHVEPLPDGAILHHTCHNTLCCNIAHLTVTTRERHRPDHHPERCRTHCPHGHALTDDNLVPNRLKRGARICLTCQRTRVLANYHQHKDKWKARQQAYDAQLTPEERRVRSRRYTAAYRARQRAKSHPE